MLARQKKGRKQRAGVALLEVIAAIAVLAIFGIATLGSLRDAMVACTRAERTEDELFRAANLLDAALLWTRDELDRRLGTHAQGPWWLTINRSSDALYELRLTDSSGARELLRAVSYRTTR